MDLEIDKVGPCGDPLIKHITVFAFHDLVASRQVRGNPAADVGEAGRGKPALGAKPLVDGPRVAASEVLNDHEEHD